MSLLLHSNINQYNINGLLCTYNEMFRIRTCCNHVLSAAEGFRGGGGGGAGGNMRGSRNFCQFYLALSLFYSLKRGSNGLLLRKLYLYFTKDPEAVQYFRGGGGGVSIFFSRGGGSNANFYKNTYTYLVFSRGSIRTPYPPLDLHMGNVIITGQYLSQSSL